MHALTGTFADPSHESAFGAQSFRLAFPLHVLLMVLCLAIEAFFVLNASHAEAAVVVDAQDAELALLRSELDRLALENDALRGEVEAARQRRWWWPWR